jgi:hypothetical protein
MPTSDTGLHTEKGHSSTRRPTGARFPAVAVMDMEEAKALVAARMDVFHESDDSIWIAYEWFDAQTKTRAPRAKFQSLKHIIENWGGRYVSRSDVEVAALMHPEIRGTYPFYNIGSRLTLLRRAAGRHSLRADAALRDGGT